MNLVCEETVNDYVDTDIFRKANNIKYIYSSSDEDSGTQTGGQTSSAESGTGSSITSSSFSSNATSTNQPQTQYCAHITTKPCFANTAVVDKTFLHDRCLENLLKDEDRHKTVCSYFYTVQKDITPPMRKIVADWMMEVSFVPFLLNSWLLGCEFRFPWFFFVRNLRWLWNFLEFSHFKEFFFLRFFWDYFLLISGKFRDFVRDRVNVRENLGFHNFFFPILRVKDALIF